jgi:hypothetical protein
MEAVPDIVEKIDVEAEIENAEKCNRCGLFFDGD